MSRTIGEITNEPLRDILIDMSFDDNSKEPCWAFDLAERLIDCGWRKQ
jgi:hypothetical protein